MKTLVLKDLARTDELDRAVSLSIRGGIACLTREAPSACPGELQPVLIRRGWSSCQPVFPGCGPVYFPLGKLPMHTEPTVVPVVVRSRGLMATSWLRHGVTVWRWT